MFVCKLGRNFFGEKMCFTEMPSQIMFIYEQKIAKVMRKNKKKTSSRKKTAKAQQEKKTKFNFIQSFLSETFAFSAIQ